MKELYDSVLRTLQEDGVNGEYARRLCEQFVVRELVFFASQDIGLHCGVVDTMSSSRNHGADRILTEYAHDILSFTYGMQQLLIAPLDSRLLREEDLLRLLVHDIGNVLDALNTPVGHHVEEHASEPRRTKVTQVWEDEPIAGRLCNRWSIRIRQPHTII